MEIKADPLTRLKQNTRLYTEVYNLVIHCGIQPNTAVGFTGALWRSCSGSQSVLDAVVVLVWLVSQVGRGVSALLYLITVMKQSVLRCC